MKYYFYLVCLLFLVSCKPISSKDATSSVKDGVEALFGSGGVDTFIVGDLDGDGLPNKAFQKKPITEGFVDPDEGMTECPGGCNVSISFDAKIPTLIHENSIGGLIYDAGDLNEDGISELLYAPDWISSCWGALIVYSLQNKQWINVGSVGIYTCEAQEYLKRLKKVDKTKFQLVGQDWNDDQTKLVDVPQFFSFLTAI